MSSSSSSPSSTVQSAPLQRLIAQVADAVQAVRGGRSLTELLARCPADLRPGTQSLSFYVLRLLASAEGARALLAPKAPPPKVEGLLLSALALLWPAEDPPYDAHTVVDQTVSAVRKRLPASAGFVNAVLRRFLRERDAIVAAVQADPVARFNHPAWWLARLQQDWPEQWQEILAANNQHPPMTLRVHARHGSAETYVQRLSQQGIAARALGAIAPQAVVLERAVPVTALPGFAQGEVSVQDAAAQLAGHLLVQAQGELPHLPEHARVLDACSAPGGKTAHILELGDFDLTALDSDARRLARVQDNLARLQLRARVLAADARQTAGWWNGERFDAILLDAPCSASGIVRRHPDVRWLRRDSDIAQLAQIQAELLDALWPTLKPGGRLVYATCSVFKAEGQGQIDAFLQRQADAKLIEVSGLSGHLLPLAHNGEPAGAAGSGPAVIDGFYYALLHKS
ncbi:16S rRNA (cytosine(967)-C(5))-methyltransferase RsmB [Paucibacter sp. KBW04]|uniref:16S rRNA (cytosine(967)-C(5))-methyltransferase RsmB n=1 Tax=Paucibacter sp. KBW04 TaxID=2153361 RepID=UPI000F58B2A0|nr:16S rRNA (cytosine(967)-C(5))-methyltransferase RsmB [Paucibacter sp. KBW04]RQO54800.1 16S rRNA (cytosine(967)-C(5))-methyltransferase RsmB [Paucibacter sp. KBW04]